MTRMCLVKTARVLKLPMGAIYLVDTQEDFDSFATITGSFEQVKLRLCCK